MPKALQQAAQLIKKKDMWELQCRERLSISAVDLIARDRDDRIQTLIRRTIYSLPSNRPGMIRSRRISGLTFDQP